MIRKLLAWWRQRRAERLDIRESLWHEVEAGLPFLHRLTPDERSRLRQLARRFIAE